MIVGPSQLGGGLQYATRGVHAAAERLLRATVPLGTGQRHHRGADEPAGAIASENLRAVFAALEAEAYSLRRTDAVAATADGALAEASVLMNDNASIELQLASSTGLSAGEADALRAQLDGNQASVARITANAAFNGVPLFDGALTLSGGGGSLSLPDLTGASPTPETITDLRGRIGAFQKDTLGARLRVIESTLQSTAKAHAIVRDTDYAIQVARLIKAQTQMQNQQQDQTQARAAAAGYGVAHRTAGSLLDVSG